MNSIEYEYKQLITLDEYNNLKQKFDKLYVCEEILQINYYYDDNDLSLFHKNETLRVRQKADKLTLERKFNKRYATSGERICDESSKRIEFLPLNVNVDSNTYSYLGELVTIRKNYVFHETVISLDISYYLGKIDYELEIESKKEDWTLPEIVSRSIEFNINYDGKYTRFIKTLKEIKHVC